MDYNNPKTWVNPALHNEPALFDKAAYQRRIDGICGLNEYGGPNVLLTWCPSQENYSRWFCEWDEAGFGTKTELRATYVYDTLDDGQGNELELPPPRWALKQFMPPAQYLLTDDQVRWKKAITGKNNQRTFVKELRPARPHDGIYVPLLRIGAHTDYCCREEKKHGLKCWGRYAEPGEEQLLILRAAVDARAADNADRPEAGITQKHLRQAATEAAETVRRREEIASAHLDGVLDEHMDSILAHILNDPSFAERTKAFSLPPEALLPHKPKVI